MGGFNFNVRGFSTRALTKKSLFEKVLQIRRLEEANKTQYVNKKFKTALKFKALNLSKNSLLRKLMRKAEKKRISLQQLCVTNKHFKKNIKKCKQVQRKVFLAKFSIKSLSKKINKLIKGIKKAKIKRNKNKKLNKKLYFKRFSNLNFDAVANSKAHELSLFLPSFPPIWLATQVANSTKSTIDNTRLLLSNSRKYSLNKKFKNTALKIMLKRKVNILSTMNNRLKNKTNLLVRSLKRYKKLRRLRKRLSIKSKEIMQKAKKKRLNLRLILKKRKLFKTSLKYRAKVQFQKTLAFMIRQVKRNLKDRLFYMKEVKYNTSIYSIIKSKVNYFNTYSFAKAYKKRRNSKARFKNKLFDFFYLVIIMALLKDLFIINFIHYLQRDLISLFSIKYVKKKRKSIFKT